MSKLKTILFRCDQNEFSGSGHFSRCLNLARHLKKSFFEVSFLGNYSEFSISLFKEYNIEYKEVEEKKFEKSHAFYLKNYQYVVFDSYFINQRYINEISSLSVKTIFIDDVCLLDFSTIDLVINFRFDADKLFKYNSKYKALGKNYFIYKPEFLLVRQNRKNVKKIKKVLLFLGGMDQSKDLIELIIKSIKEINSKILISVISNEQNLLLPNVEILPQTFNIEKYLNTTDFVINGGGLIKYECVFCTIPSATISATVLQKNDTEILESKGLIYNLGSTNEINFITLSNRLKEIFLDVSFQSKLIKQSSKELNINSIENILNIIDKI